MNEETASRPAQEPEIDQATLDAIEHPPDIDDVMLQLDPAEVVSNPAMAPQMLNEGEDLRDDLRRD